MTELDKYELKPGGYYAIKFPDSWSPCDVGNYMRNILSNKENTPNIIPLFNGLELVDAKEVEND